MSPLALGFIKLSILFFYRRVFRGRIFDLLNWTLITLVVLWTLGFFLVQVFDCGTRFYVNWGRLSDLQKCLSSFKQLLACSISDVIIDIFILILPMPLIWMLHMPPQKKIAVTGIFLLGTLAVVFGILRMIVFAQILGAGHTQVVLRILGVTTLDDMAVVSLILFWPMLEMGVAIVAICLPTLRPLLHSVSLESMVRSVRSKLSIDSLRNHSRPSSTKGDAPKASQDSGRALAAKTFVTSSKASDDDDFLDTHVTTDVETGSARA
ncbi:uncharacterized protein KY384_008551 [Bacidia gigantensis]|uniref:uncharacterized protein n=1 Tax=Bacidia gigantensis TaxID=2732470 RepID=UPI001D04B397|nr:uncharacterized protein KY384_008551 [Bacidia gigantensis]KAG8527122.1 hypothetical protein KY384_008551 [Bacidia gigantensis]